MEVYVARQPIFDSKMQIFGYELLYRKSKNNYYEGIDDDSATSLLINDSFFVFGFKELIGETKGFINFPQNLLMNGLAYVLPNDSVVIEILERVDPTPEVIQACRKLKENGYVLALDDFVLDQYSSYYLPLIEMADIIKVEFPTIKGNGIPKLMRELGGQILFLAEKVETRDDYQRAKNMGFQLFQGYYFSKPVMANAKDIGTLDVNLVQILNAANEDPIDYNKITQIIQKDISLSYKFLKMSNSVHYGSKYQISNIRQGLTFLGSSEIKRWVNLMMFRGIQKQENSELVKLSMIRGEMLGLISALLKVGNEADYYICGIFSSIDDLLNTNMEKALEGIILSQEVRDALCCVKNQLRWYLDLVLSLEQAKWDLLDTETDYPMLTADQYMSLYYKALKRQKALE